MTSGALEVIVPARGESVSTIAELEDGSWQSFVVARDADGRVRIVEETSSAAQASASASAAAPPSACKDRAYTLQGFAWKKTWEWRFRAGSTPETNAESAVEQRLREAAANITSSHNDCGLADQVVATQKYLGRTTHDTNIVSKLTSYSCGARDGQNVVEFGVLPHGIVGIACVWWDGDGGLEADVRLNDRGYRWFGANTPPRGCSNAFSVEGVATHELGHVFGLAHVSEAAHGNLTMSTRTRPCSVADATLGLGDVLGLRKVYTP